MRHEHSLAADQRFVIAWYVALQAVQLDSVATRKNAEAMNR